MKLDRRAESIDVERKVAIERMTLDQRSLAITMFSAIAFSLNFYCAAWGGNFLPKYFPRAALDTWN